MVIRIHVRGREFLLSAFKGRMLMIEKIRQRLTGTFNFCMGALLSLALVVLYFNTPSNPRQIPVDKTAFPLIFAVIFLIIIGLAYLFRKRQMIRPLTASQKSLIIAIWLISILHLQFFYARNGYICSWGWDCQAVTLWSDATEEQAKYFLQYPNNIVITYIFSLAKEAGEFLGNDDPWLACIYLNIIFVDVAIVLSMNLCKKMLSNGAFMIMLVLSTAMIALAPQVLISYSDTMSMLFPIAILYLLILSRESKALWRKIIIWLTLGFLSYLGFLLKPYVLIIWIAYAVWRAMQGDIHFSFHSLRRGLCLAVAFIIGIIPVIAFQNQAKASIAGEFNREELYDQYEIPWTHFLMMGLNRESNGSFDSDDLNATVSISGKDAKSAYNLSEVKNRLAEMGIGGFVKHIWQKFVFIVSDGTFFYGAEGDTMQEPAKEGIEKFLGNFNNVHTFFYQQYYSQFLHVCWGLTLLGASIVAFAMRRQKKPGFEFVLLMTIFGMLIALLLLEARSRYLYMYLPFFLMLAAQGLTRVTFLLTSIPQTDNK